VVASRDTVTEATGTTAVLTVAETVSDFPPEMPLIVARITTDPGATPVTSPVDETVAIVVSDDAQTGSELVTVLPCVSFATALATAVCPAAIDVESIVTVTVDTLFTVGPFPPDRALPTSFGASVVPDKSEHPAIRPSASTSNVADRVRPRTGVCITPSSNE
jgi:hypothetical protein